MDLLTQLADKHGCDKGSVCQYDPNFLPHNFASIYNEIFFESREKVRRVLEVGIFKGASLRMWKDYFPNAAIFGIDCVPEFCINENRITTFNCSQIDEEKIKLFIEMYGDDFDIIIDDGGHDTLHTQVTMGILFKYVKKGGYYIIEDLHASLGTYGAQHMAYHNITPDHDFTAYNVIKRFAETKFLHTIYLAPEVVNYISSNTDKIEVIDVRGDLRSITSVIKKK